MVRASGQVVGPGLGGALVSLVGAASVVLIQAVTFVVSAASVLAIRTREEPIPSHVKRPALRRQIVEGLSFVGRNPILRATAIASAAANFSFALASAVSFIFMSRTLDLSPTAIGLIVAAGSVSVMLGAAFPLGALTGGILGERIGLRGTLWLSGVIVVLAPVPLFFALRHIRDVDEVPCWHAGSQQEAADSPEEPSP